MPEEKQWEGTTFGNSLMHRWLISVLRWTDVRFIYLFAYVFVIPFCVLFSPGFRHSYRYFHKHQGATSIGAFLLGYKNHCLFAEAVIDKFAMYAGKTFTINIEGYEHFLKLAHQPKAFIQMSSHVGNYEIAGYSLTADSKRFNALVYGGEKASVMTNRNKMFEGTNIRMIPIGNDMTHLFMMEQALQNGEILSMPADRILGSQKSIAVNFLGEKANFPLGPFSVATMHGLDVLSVHVMKTSWTGYTIYVTPLSYPREASRREQINHLASAYVQELERMVHRYPTQWYNYFDFWK